MLVLTYFPQMNYHMTNSQAVKVVDYLEVKIFNICLPLHSSVYNMCMLPRLLCVVYNWVCRSKGYSLPGAFDIAKSFDRSEKKEI